MAGTNWGECRACKFFEVEPGVMAEAHAMGLCIVHDHEVRKLRVSGACGCTEDAQGRAAHPEGPAQPRRRAPILDRI